MKAIYSLGYNLSVKFCYFFLNYIAINLLLIKDYGKFTLLYSTITSALIVTGFGLLYSSNIITSKWYNKNNKFLMEYFKFSLYLIFILSLFFSLIISIFYNNFVLIFFIIFIFSISFMMDGFFYGISKINILFFLGGGALIFSLPIIYLFVTKYGFKGALFGFLFSKLFLVLGQVFFFIRIFKNNLFLDLKINKINKIILFYRKYNMPLVLSGLIATPVITLCIYMLSFFKGVEEVAVFSWCYQVYLLGMFIPVALGSYYLSIFSKSNLNDKIIHMNKVTKFNIAISTISMILMFFLTKYILVLGNVEQYSDAYIIFYSFIITMFFYSLNLGYVSLWSSLGKNIFQLKLQLLWSCLLVLVVLSFVRKYGALSIPLGMSIGFIMQYIIQSYSLNKIKEQK